MFKNKKQSAFTLAEIFIAMVVLSILVAVCLTFFVNRRDYEREYFFYTAYRNIVNVVDSALMNEAYIKGASAKVEDTDCGYYANPEGTFAANNTKCRAFKTDTDLCDIFNDYFNTTKIYNSAGVEVTPCSVVTTSPTAANVIPSLKISNGMEFYFKSETPEALGDISFAQYTAAEANGYVLWVDLNGKGRGEDKLNYDIMKFYITRSGRVIPTHGSVVGTIRGYEYLPEGMDAGGNTGLMSFDIVYSPEDSNHVRVLDSYHSVPFVVAACASGYVFDDTGFCKENLKQKVQACGAADTNGYYSCVSKVSECTPDMDCKIRLVKKLKRLK